MTTHVTAGTARAPGSERFEPERHRDGESPGDRLVIVPATKHAPDTPEPPPPPAGYNPYFDLPPA